MAETQQGAEVKAGTGSYPGLYKAMEGNTFTSQQTAAPKQDAAPQPENKAEQPAAPQPFNVEELDEKEKSEILSKLTNGRIKSISDLDEKPVAKTKEQIEHEAQKRKADIRAWALETGKAKPQDFDDMAVDMSKSDRDIALAIFTKNLRAEDEKITDEEALELFGAAYHEGAEEVSPRLYAQGQKEIKKIADAYKKEKYASIEGLDAEYDQVLQSDGQFKAYKAQVKKVVSELPKQLSVTIPYKNLDGTESELSYEIPVDEKIINKLASDYTKSDAFVVRNVSSNGKIDESSIASEMNYHLKAMLFDTAIPTMLQKHAENVEAKLMVQLGNKRIPATSLNDGKQTGASQAPKQNEYSGLRKAMAQN